ncbi:MAG TPA: ABC transporter permease [Thermoanaerobaculaceae bacterium]|nr:ABC transporter permease [Thermoanaerobaculaceae bacterium]
MRKAFAVFKREYLEVVRKKSFIIMTLIFPFLMGGMMFVPTLLAVRGIEGKRVVVVDGTGKLSEAFAEKPSDQQGENSPMEELTGKKAGNQTGQRVTRSPELKAEYVAASGDLKVAAQPYLDRLKLDRGRGADRLDGVLLIPGDAFTNPEAKMTYYSRAASDFITQERLGNIVNRAVSRGRLASRGIEPAEADRLLKRLQLEGVRVSKSGEEKKGGELSFLIGFLFVALLIFPNLIYGQEVMRGIVQEKSERIVEILISSVPSLQLLGGKVMGLAAVGLTQVMAWMVMGGLMAAYTGGAAAMAGINVFQYFNLSVIPWFFVFFVLAYLTNVCIYAVAGSVSNSEKEAQQFMGPIMMIVFIPWILAFPILQNPDSTLATVLSLIPVFTPVTMFMRVLVAEPPVSQLILSIALSVATIYVFSWITAKIFRVGILSYGKRPSPAELWRWLKVA